MPIFQASLNTSSMVSGAAQGKRAVNQLGDSLDAMQAKGERAASAVSGALVDLAKKAAVGFSAYKAFDIGKDATLAAGRYEALGVAMYQVGGNAGYSKQQLDEYAASLEKNRHWHDRSAANRHPVGERADRPFQSLGTGAYRSGCGGHWRRQFHGSL